MGRARGKTNETRPAGEHVEASDQANQEANGEGMRTSKLEGACDQAQRRGQSGANTEKKTKNAARETNKGEREKEIEREREREGRDI